MNFQYVNHNAHTIHVPDKNGHMVAFTRGQKKILDEWFKRYVPKYLTIVKVINENQIPKQQVIINDSAKKIGFVPKPEFKTRPAPAPKAPINVLNRHIVGKVGKSGQRATEFSVANVRDNAITISNNTGIGILSYNRLPAITTLIASIRRHTDLTRTTVFVSDESSDPAVWAWLSQQKDIVAIHNDRIGIAGNSNRLLRCLERFKYKLLLNDDVEILNKGWDSFYFEEMARTGYKHFCYQQAGVYGSLRPMSNSNGIITIKEKPHGAVMALHDDAFRKVGYFDEMFGIYGMEHVDYSDRVSMSGVQPSGYFDVAQSDYYFKIHPDASVDENKSSNFSKAQAFYGKVKGDKNRLYIAPTNKSAVPSMSFVIPFREQGRTKALDIVIASIRSQKFPAIQIILVEQDEKQHIDSSQFGPIDYCFLEASHGTGFCKSAAFNQGVIISKNNKVVLHDGDMLARSDYAAIINSHLDDNESVHIGSTVSYMTRLSTDRIINNHRLDESTIESERVVTYYEGGSLAVRRDVYINIGGFCEDFVGYGVEDCDFFRKIKTATKMLDNRYVDLFHLFHGRNANFESDHARNKQIGEQRGRQSIDSLIKIDAQNLKKRLG